jgi:Tfp pilus assembly protein PilX
MTRRHAGEGGIALMMLVAIGGVLAVLAATSVMALANQQGATASDRSHKADLNYAEAALNSAVDASKRVPAVSQTAAFLDSSAMLTDYNAAAAADPSYPTGSSVKTIV